MDRSSGSTNLRRLLRKHSPLNVPQWYCKGPLSVSKGPKISQNYMKYNIWALFNISTSCNLVMNMFSGSTNLWGLLGVF